jgi:hypothetical protein
MELGRWGRGKFSQLSKGYRELTSFLSEVLDGERGLIESENDSAAPYEVRDDFVRLLSEPSLKTLKGRSAWLEFFVHLGPYFEAGFLLHDQPESSSAMTLEAMFIFGRVFRSDASATPELSLGLPRIRDGHVYKGRAEAVLKTFKLDKVTRLKDSAAFAVSPEAGTTIVLICGRPRLWQIDSLERMVSVMVALKEAR